MGQEYFPRVRGLEKEARFFQPRVRIKPTTAAAAFTAHSASVVRMSAMHGVPPQQKRLVFVSAPPR